jgi:pimeloyl-ACP methyl ester carboxylesterase
MKQFHCIRLICIAFFAALASTTKAEQPLASIERPTTYTVFVRSRAVGQEAVTVTRAADGWSIRGNNRFGPPLDIATRKAEIDYDSQWRPKRILVEGTVRGQELSISTSFADGQATNEITSGGQSATRIHSVAADTVVLSNAFLGGYAALARRLVGQSAGTSFRAYTAPQGEVVLRLDGVFPERIETPREAIAATRYALTAASPPPAVDVQVSIWVDREGHLLRVSVPAQTLEVARDDIASAAARTTSFSLPGDEAVRIPAAGFGLGASITRPAQAKGPLPAVILIGGSSALERDGSVAGIPVIGQMAGELVSAGFFVVRFDKRGAGQSGGRTETATLGDYAEDVRAIVRWVEKRKDVDKNRIGLVGHSEGAWVALIAAARDDNVRAVSLIAAASTSGGQLILEQQRHVLERMKLPDAEKQAKVALQQRIQDAALKGGGWEGIPPELRRVAESPWFQSFLGFDPAKVVKDVRQPMLIVHGELDTQVRPYHADRLAELARATNRKTPVEVVKVPGVNHLLVRAKTGEVDEYSSLPEKKIAPGAVTAIAKWMAKVLG